MGNLRSVSKALEHVAPDAEVVVTADPERILSCERIVVPGQGAMPDCMRQLAASGAREAVIETKRLEHEADAVHRSAISRLFGEETDAITIIKWKEIFDFLEAATDRCAGLDEVTTGLVLDGFHVSAPP